MPTGATQKRLADKVIVLGGGAGGTGEQISLRLAAEGATVVIGDINLAAAENLAERIIADGGKAEASRFDVTDRAQVASLVEHAEAAHGRLDGVHMIASDPGPILSDGDLLSLSIETWRASVEGHLFTYAEAARIAIPLMQKNGGGTIIFTSSAAGRSAEVTRLAYQTVKISIETMTRHIAHTYGKDGIRCNTICYGLILTEMAQKHLPQQFLDETMRRMWSPRHGTPTDVCGIAALLHSLEGEWINGQVIDVNGGMLLRA
jgi:NAD(P)-dependent dehydrogenase (short-subunit alcohol dehydrogenase family)